MDTQSDTEMFREFLGPTYAALRGALPQTRHSAGKSKAENGRIPRVTEEASSVAKTV